MIKDVLFAVTASLVGIALAVLLVYACSIRP